MKKLITILLMAFAVIVVSCSNEEITGTGEGGATPPDVIKGQSIITTIPNGYPNSGKVLRTVISADGKTVTVSIESATRSVIAGEYVLETSEGNNLLYKHKTADAYVAFTLVNNKLQVVNNTFAGITDANKNNIDWDISTESTYIPNVDADVNAALANIEKEQLGGVEGLTKYLLALDVPIETTGTYDVVVSLYFNANKSISKIAEVTKFNGRINIEDPANGNKIPKDFNNEIVKEVASQYTVTDISGNNLVKLTGRGNPPETSVPVDYQVKKYKLYRMVATEEKSKASTKIYDYGFDGGNPLGTGKWETTSSSELRTEYYLIKEVGDKLYAISVDLYTSNGTPNDPSDDKYIIYSDLNNPSTGEIFTKL